MRLKKLIIVAIGILIVGGWLLLGQRTYSPPSTVEEASPTEYSNTQESNQANRKPTSASAPNSYVTSSINSEFTSMPSVTQALNDSPGKNAATGTSPDELFVITSSPSINTSDLTEGLIGDQSTPPGRLAPDVLVDPLQFTNIRIYKATDVGVFAGQANIKNVGTAFLNQLVLSWRILDSATQVLDQGEFTWPNLAPGETTTITFIGKAAFLETWNRIEFTYVQ